MNYLGIDLGSTFLKSSLLDTGSGTVMPLGGEPTPGFLPLGEGKRELDIKELTEAVTRLIDAAMKAHTISGILFSVQMHGFMLFDAAGEPLTGYATWQDTRANIPFPESESLFDMMKKRVPERLFRENGILLAPNHSVLPLCHHLLEHPEHRGARFAMLGDAVTYLLTGKEVPLHPSQAASTALYSLEKQDWNRELIEELGLSALQLPEVSENVCRDALYKGVPVMASIGDHQAAVLGIGAGRGDLFINIATGGQVGYIDEGLTLGDYETRPFFDGLTIRTFTDLPSGRDLAVLKDLTGEIGRSVFGIETQDAELWSRIDAAVAAADGAGGITAELGFFGGGGAIKNLGPAPTIAGIFLAFYDAMADFCRKKAEKLVGDGEIRRIICTGGVLRRNKRLLSLIEERFGTRCVLPAAADDTMQGLLAFAAQYAE